jgi:hypothetical protein
MASTQRRRVSIAALLIAAGVVASTPVTAASLWCTGLVQRVLLYSEGGVMAQMSYRAEFTHVCNLHGSWAGIAAEVCMHWHASLMSARREGKATTIYYPEAGSATCATLPTYGASLAPG